MDYCVSDLIGEHGAVSEAGVVGKVEAVVRTNVLLLSVWKSRGLRDVGGSRCAVYL